VRGRDNPSQPLLEWVPWLAYGGSLFICAFVALCACGGGGTSYTALPAPTALELTPADIDLTPGTLSDTFNGQGDVAGVSYTPLTSSHARARAEALWSAAMRSRSLTRRAHR